MFGPFAVECDDCRFAERVECGETAQKRAETHSRDSGHAVCITDVNTGADMEVRP